MADEKHQTQVDAQSTTETNNKHAKNDSNQKAKGTAYNTHSSYLHVRSFTHLLSSWSSGLLLKLAMTFHSDSCDGPNPDREA